MYCGRSASTWQLIQLSPVAISTEASVTDSTEGSVTDNCSTPAGCADKLRPLQGLGSKQPCKAPNGCWARVFGCAAGQPAMCKALSARPLLLDAVVLLHDPDADSYL